MKPSLALVLALTTLAAGVSLAAFQPAVPGAVGNALRGVPEPVAAIEPELFVPPPDPGVKPINEEVLTLAFSPDGKKLVTAGAWWGLGGQIKIWDVARARELVTLRGVPGVRTVAFSPQGTLFATGDFKGTIRLRDSTTGEERAAVKAQQAGINGLAFSPDGETLACAVLDRTVKLFSVKDLKERQVLRGHTEMVLSVAYFRQAPAIVSCGGDRTARIWDLTTGKEKFILKGHAGGVEMVAISPDDQVIATASWDATIRLWDAATGQEQATFKAAKPIPFNAVAFSPDGTRLAGAGADGTVSLWDVKTKQLIGSLQKHVQTVWTLAFSPDGNLLASGSSDTTAKLWDLKAGKEAATLRTSLAGQLHSAGPEPGSRTRWQGLWGCHAEQDGTGLRQPDRRSAVRPGGAYRHGYLSDVRA